MADLVEVAIQAALQARLASIGFSPSLPVSWPNKPFTPPTSIPGATYLRATFLPAPPIDLGISFSDAVQHQGIFQVDVFQSIGGSLDPSRIAAQVLAWFKRGTTLTRDGFVIQVLRRPTRLSERKDEPWTIVPVSIPYTCFAIPA